MVPAPPTQIAAEPNVTHTFLKLCTVENADVILHCLGFLERVLSHVDGVRLCSVVCVCVCV